MTKLINDSAQEADYLIHKCISEIFKNMVWYGNSEGRFGESGRKGDSGEGVVERYLAKNSIPFEKKTDPNSQVNLKIDFVVEGVTMDVKTNIYKGFLGVEVYDNDLNKGWIYTTTARWIYGVDLINESIYRYDVDVMRKFVEKNKHRAKPTKQGAYILWVHKDEPFIERLQ